MSVDLKIKIIHKVMIEKLSVFETANFFFAKVLSVRYLLRKVKNDQAFFQQLRNAEQIKNKKYELVCQTVSNFI